MKKLTPYAVITHILALIGVGALIAAPIMQAQLNSMAREVTQLQNNINAAKTDIAGYERTLCSAGVPEIKASSTTPYVLEVDGVARTYSVKAPSQYDASKRYPVILSFDGIEGSGERIQSYAGLDALPALIVYPDSLPGVRGYTAWQGAPYSVSGERDVTFVSQLLDTLPSQYCVDATQVFAVGMSNGGQFANIIGCELGNRVRAVASVSGAYYTTCTREQRTPSLLVLHSKADHQVPFKGEAARRLPHIEPWVAERAAAQKCRVSVPVVHTHTAASYNWLNCADNSMVRLVVVKDQPHGWLNVFDIASGKEPTTAEYIWKFFEDARYR